METGKSNDKNRFSIKQKQKTLPEVEKALALIVLLIKIFIRNDALMSFPYKICPTSMHL